MSKNNKTETQQAAGEKVYKRMIRIKCEAICRYEYDMLLYKEIPGK